jgi:hypothetical protein
MDPAEDGDGAGYDVLSFDLAGRERLLEVKTTNGSARMLFSVTRNERDLAAERFVDWSINRVHMFVKNPRIFTIAPPLRTPSISGRTLGAPPSPKSNPVFAYHGPSAKGGIERESEICNVGLGRAILY